MYRIKKVFNHNTVLALDAKGRGQYLIMGKGIGFGKKVTEIFDVTQDCTIYSLSEKTRRGSAEEIVKSVPSVFLEIADEILREAEKSFGKIDRTILFPMADHIAFAVKRIQNREAISNPLTDDIRVLFHMEYKVAEKLRSILKERLNVEIDEHEIGYVALHVHSAIEDENVSAAMQTANAVRRCITLVETQLGHRIDVQTLTYNRLMNHVKYMVARAQKGEKLKLNMNDYMEVKFPESFRLAAEVCRKLEEDMRVVLEDAETGYLAMHIERVCSGEI